MSRKLCIEYPAAASRNDLSLKWIARRLDMGIGTYVSTS